MKQRNEKRIKKVQSFQKAIMVAEKESEEEAFELVRDFRSAKKSLFSQIEELQASAGGNSGGSRTAYSQVEEFLEGLRDDLDRLQEQLMKNEIEAQDSIDEAIDHFEATTNDLTKVMIER